MSYDRLKGKALLVLGGTAQQIKIVQTAKEMGIRTIVTDYLDNSPAKLFADERYNIDILDVDGLVDLCLKEQVDGVISAYIDPCQRPYNELCDRMGYYCYGNREQFQMLTDKHDFKKLCMDNDIDIIPDYNADNLEEIVYPVFVKPVDSRGSRGQSICYSESDVKKAIKEAKAESSNGKIIIEKYMENACEFQVTYFFLDGEAHLLRTCDSYCGNKSNHMNNVATCAVSPSRFTGEFIKETNDKIVRMLKNIGITNGPVFMQGFVDDGVFRFFDPGFRFPGVDYERIIQKVYDLDIIKALINYALYGSCGPVDIPSDIYLLNGMRAAIFFPFIQGGTIETIIDKSLKNSTDGVVSYIPRYMEGDKVEWTYNVNQRSAEIDMISADIKSLKELLKNVQEEYLVIDTDGKDMRYDMFDVDRIM